MSSIPVTLFTDPSCPFGYSAMPFLRALDWRYGDQLDWDLKLIVLSEDPKESEAKGFTPLKVASFQPGFARWGMPFDKTPKSRLAASADACRAIIATRIDAPGRELEALRALQRANFTTTALIDDHDDIRAALEQVQGLDAAAIVARIGDTDVEEAYQADRAAARSAAGTAGAVQGKTGMDGDVERFSAPSVVFHTDGGDWDVTGMQPLEAYDVVVTNLDTSISRAAAPEHARAVIERYPEGVVTQEVAVILAKGNDLPDRDTAERQLQELLAEGFATRTPTGNDAVWAKA